MQFIRETIVDKIIINIEECGGTYHRVTGFLSKNCEIASLFVLN